jgi:hypothetical protein
MLLLKEVTWLCNNTINKHVLTMQAAGDPLQQVIAQQAVVP